jgi:HAD superfamily hydrolase (TIGR01549 family)
MVRDFVVSLDLDDTLVTDNRLERTVALARLDTLAAEHATRYDRAAAEFAIDEFLSSDREHDRGTDIFIAWFYERFARAGRSAMNAAHGYRAAAIAEAANHVTAIPGARETLAELDRLTIPYAMLTNGWSPLQEAKASLIGFRGSVFVSERIGARKPAPEAFAPLREHFGVPFGRIWHVGDNPRADCGGAKRVGMTTVWFDRQSGRYPADVAAPDYVVHSQAELLALLTRERACAAPRKGALPQ